MKPASKQTFAIALFLLLNNLGFSQKGIYSYADTVPLHTQIIDILENTKSGEIYMLGNTTDLNFEHAKPYFARVDKNGKILFTKYFDTEVYSLCSVILLDDVIKIFGTQNYSGFSQYTTSFDSNGESKSNTLTMDITSGLLEDVVNLNDGTSLRLSSRRKGDFFNIRISRLDNKLDYATLNFPIKAGQNEIAGNFCMLKDKSLLILGTSLDDEYQPNESVLHHYTIEGDSLWSITIPDAKRNTSQHIGVDVNNQIYYMYSLVYEDYTTELFVSTVSEKGEFSNQKSISDIIPQGMISLKDGNMLIYGYKYVVSGESALRKAKFVIVDNKNEVVIQDEIKDTDPPDSEMPSYEFVLMPSSSEFLTAFQLSDGRIALAGRVFFPVNATTSGENKRLNKPLLVIMTKDGEFR
ncbi:MAG: hypothetical protein KKA07_15370 [Bacteroidetes bacterium]|nr:hypothetical protein [Bacteroidota bacterium]MBU1720442.1 hypothetical protein [Bacteroidota bacterium]